MAIIAQGQISMAKVADGTNGTSAPTITSVVEEYYLSTSQTSCAGGAWSTTIPTWVSGKFYWKRVKTTYSNSSTTTSTAVLDSAMNDAMTKYLEVKTSNDTLLISVADNNAALGVPFKIPRWITGSINTANGGNASATGSLRSDYIPVTTGEQYIPQLIDGTSATMNFHFYDDTAVTIPIEYEPIATQYTISSTVGTYTNTTVIPYLNGLGFTGMSITAATTTNPYSSAADYIVLYKIPFGSNPKPDSIRWYGRKDTSDGIALLFTNGAWVKVGDVTATANTYHTWELTASQKNGLPNDAAYIAFFSIKNGSYAGIYNASTSPFTFNTAGEAGYNQLSYLSSSAVVTVPSGATKMRVKVATSESADDYTGNAYKATTRADYTKVTSVYSALLMQRDVINLRVGKGDIINQVNLSTEGVLISGTKVHITGQTTIDNAVIAGAMLKDAAITNAKIADATIASAKIASIDAAKITTGTLAAARIAAGTITADKLAANILTAMTASASIRITGTTIGYYNGSTLVTEINSQGMTIRRDGTAVGTIGANNISGHSDWRGLVFDLEYGTEYMTWAHKDSSGASSYTQKFTWYASKLQNGMSKGFHFGDVVYFGDKVGVCYSDGSERHVRFTTTTISSAYETIQSGGGTAGIVFGGSNLFLCDDGIYVDFGIIREICKKLAGKTIALPTGFNSNGTATGWYAATAFNTWTQYT